MNARRRIGGRAPATGIESVFVYGSLLPGLHNYGVVSSHVVAAREGRVRGRLVDAGRYPALLPDSSRTVRGIWLDVSIDALPALDELEGFSGIEETNDYERIWTTDADRPEQCGWLYVWTESRGCPPVDSDWWPEAARGKGIEP
ncbi:gamma-glutamylcyclotransferase [Cohnella sp. GCM10027633]|uniref:gamma-glutamylcyclotransferase family protein n=1 Tax=unclassified Cohnella TaxID=2636738 RepID=UPI00363020C9